MVPAVASLVAAALAFAPLNHAAHHRTHRQTSAHLFGASRLEVNLLRDINQERARHGLRGLRWSSRLRRAADQHSASMAAKGYFAHESADGSAFWKRIAVFYGYRGYRSWSVGENLLWSSPGISPSGALRMWMNSPPHRENLLSRTWRDVGLSAVHVERAPGVYGGNEVTIVTADFGVRF